MAIGISTSYHLGEFMRTMMDKRKLEYEAAYNRYQADVAGAKAIGKGISSIGGAIGSIGQGIGGYMKQSAADKSAMAIGQEEGVPLTSQGFGAADELKQRMAAGQFNQQQDQGMTPYQQAQVGLGRSRLDVEIQRLNDQRDAAAAGRAAAATRSQSDDMTKTVNNAQSYYANTESNSNNMWNAPNEQQFNAAAQRQRALNIAGRKAGVPEEEIQWVPDKYVPPSEMPAYNVYRSREAFAQGRSRPGDIGEASMRYQQSRAAASEEGEEAPAVEYGNAPGQIRPPSYNKYPSGQEPPPGAVPVGPNFNQPKGFKARFQGKDYVFDGGDWLLPVLQ